MDVMVNVDTGNRLQLKTRAEKKGVSFGYNEVATKKAHGDILAFLAEVLK